MKWRSKCEMTTMDSGFALERFNSFYSWVIVQSEKDKEEKRTNYCHKETADVKKTATLANDRRNKPTSKRMPWMIAKTKMHSEKRKRMTQNVKIGVNLKMEKVEFNLQKESKKREKCLFGQTFWNRRMACTVCDAFKHVLCCACVCLRIPLCI